MSRYITYITARGVAHILYFEDSVRPGREIRKSAHSETGVLLLISTIPSPRTIRPGLSQSLRCQLVATLGLGVALPAATVLYALNPHGLLSAPTIHSVITAASVAVLLVIFLRKISIYPNEHHSSYILPVATALYGLAIAAILLLRLDYSSKILLATSVATICVQYAISALNGRAATQLFLVVPEGRTSAISRLQDLRTRFLTRPQLPDSEKPALIADLHHNLSPEWERFLAETAISGTPVYHYKQVWEAATGRVQIEHLSENSFGALIPHHTYRKVKRLADLAFLALAAPLLFPLLLLIAALIKLDSPGPALFRQRRMGYRGRVFEVIKFRTMTCAADGEDAAVSITQQNDSRITRLGRFLRKTRLDELPQMLNILRGEMSWIGPRPEAVSLSNIYEAKIPFYRYRHIVRPGISGWAQVNQGHVTDLGDIDEKLQYDFYYIKNFSYWIDLLIVFKTLRVVLSGFGAK